MLHCRVFVVCGDIIYAVIVAPKLRGCGLGRRIMEEAERHARKLRLSHLHLFTKDKEQFYSHLGYGRGPVVSPQKKCIARLDIEQV